MNSVINIVVPVFGVVMLGFGLARAGVFNPATSEGLTRFMFYVAVPAMLFRTLATTELPDAVPWPYVFAFYGSSFFVFVLGAALAHFGFGWSRRDQGIAAVSSSYSNMVMLGLPLIVSAYGPPAKLPLFILLALQSTLMFPATTWMIEHYGRDQGLARPNVLVATGKLLLNPVILSLVLGVATNFLGLAIHPMLARGLDTVGAAAPACALVALGVGLAQYELRGTMRNPAYLVVLKGLVHPACVWAACHIAGVPVLWTQVAVLLAAMPTGINAFIFARTYDSRVEVVSKTIVLSTLLSMISISLLLHLFLR